MVGGNTPAASNAEVVRPIPNLPPFTNKKHQPQSPACGFMPKEKGNKALPPAMLPIAKAQSLASPHFVPGTVLYSRRDNNALSRRGFHLSKTSKINLWLICPFIASSARFDPPPIAPPEETPPCAN